MNNIERLNQRFAKDYNLPINIFSEEMFNYYANLYDFFPNDVYNSLLDKVNNEYGGNVDKWLEYCAEVRDRAISTITESEEWKRFNAEDMGKYSLHPTVGEHSCYTWVTVGKAFLSIDLRKANFQALKYAGVLKDKTYGDFIERMGGDDYIKNSKYLRQVIFGKMNPSRQITVEKYMIQSVADYLGPYLDKENFHLFSMNSDELLYEVKDFDKVTEDFTSSIEDRIADKLGIEVKVESIGINKLAIENPRGNYVDAYERINLQTKETTLKKASATFFPQIYKIWKNKEIEERDRVFFFEDQLATFNEPLRETQIMPIDVGLN